MCGSVSTSSVRPVAVMITPIHWREPTWQPNSRSPSTASITTPVESATWTSDSGARASAATCRTQAPAAIAMPITNQRERNRPRTLFSGARNSTRGACDGAAVLAQEPELRDGRAQQREPDTDVQKTSPPLP